MKIRLILSALMIFYVGVMFAGDKVDVKKGKIILNKQPVALISHGAGDLSNVYQISSMDGEVKFTLHQHYGDGEWFEIISPSGDKTNDMNAKTFALLDLNNDKHVAENLCINQYPLVGKDGPTDELLQAFFNGPKLGKTAARKKEEARHQQVIASEDSVAVANHLKIYPNGKLYANDSLVGYVSKAKGTDMESGSKSTMTTYNFIDLDHQSVGKMQYRPGFMISSLTLNNGESYNIEYVESNKIETDVVAMDCYKKIYASGYTFKHQHMDQLANASDNIYDKKGYVIDKDGKKHEGLINIEFYALVENPNMPNLRSYGDEVLLVSKDENGKEVKETFKAKDGVRFAYYKPDETEQSYIGMPIMAVVKSTKFCQIMYENQENYVIRYIVKPEKLESNDSGNGFDLLKVGSLFRAVSNSTNYYVKLKGHDNAVTVGAGSKKNQKSKFDDFVKCPSLHFDDYKDYQSLETLKRFVADYVSKCGQ